MVLLGGTPLRASGPGAAALLLAMALLAPSPSEGSVSAVQKVVQLLTDMEAKAKEMKNAEAVAFSEFRQFCLDTTASKDKEVKAGSQRIESLTAEVGKLKSDIAELGGKIAELQGDIAKSTADLAAAKTQRGKDSESYTSQVQDFAESVDALERAIATLKKQNYDRTGLEALLQLSSAPGVPEKVRRNLAAFLETHAGDDFLTRDAPEANAYEFQSTSILDLLNKLHAEFTEKRTDAEKEEMNSKHAFQLLSQDLHDAIEGATADIADKSADLQEKKRLAAEGSKELALATTDRDQDAAYLSDLKVECDEKSKSFEEKQALRADELAAIAEAIRILSSESVLGAAKAHLPAAASLVQLPGGARPASLVQLRGAAGAGAGEAPDGARRRELVGFLKGEGRRLRSNRLGMLAERVANTADPFVKVKKLIEEMIHRLLQEAGEETDQKGWCDTELGTNKQTRTKLQDTIDGLTSKIDSGEATLMEISERLATLAKEVSELTGSVKETTAMRQAEKAKNAATVDDARAAQQAIQQATMVLKDFYAKASTATALVQASSSQRASSGAIKASHRAAAPPREAVKMGSEEWNSLANPNFVGEVDRGHKAGMQTFGDTYTGSQDEAGGVLAILEVIASDFASLEAETSTAEATAESEHKDFMAKSQKSIAVKEKETEMLTVDKRETQMGLSTDKKDLAATQDQLLAADRYYEKLRPSCVDTGISYDQRAKARKEEIQSLKEALQILSGGEDLTNAV